MSEHGHYIRFNVDPLASTQCAEPGSVPPAKSIHYCVSSQLKTKRVCVERY